MARNNVRLINYHTTGTTAPKKTDMAVGEIAVGKDLIWSKHNANEELSVFISSGAVHSAISAATTVINGTINALSTKVDANTENFGHYATSADTVAADEKVLSSAKTYTDTLKGSDYANETLAGLKSEINAIKGDSYKTGTTLASLESNLGIEKLRIDAILQDAPSGLTSFKDVEDEINSKISSVYKVRGTKATYAELPIEGNNVGDVYNVTAANGNTPAGTNYVCTATTGTRDKQWDALGGTVDLSTYATITYVNDALTGVTGAGSTSIVTRLGTAETKIENLQKSASTLNTDVQTIKGWKINDKFISGSPILNGKDIKVDDTSGAQTLKDAIAAAKKAGDSAMTYAQGVSGSVKTLNDTVVNNKTTIDAYTVNGTEISKNPVLTGENVLVGGESANSAKTLNTTIAEAKAAGTAASEAINALRDEYEGTIKSINDSVSTNTSNITGLRNDVDAISPKVNSAVQTITVTHTETNGIKAEKTGTTVTFNFDNMVIDCGDF